jgi:ABC-type dipeptide/oligopeptide/nickel transport system ATPase component
MTNRRPLLAADFSAAYQGKDVLDGFRLDIGAGEIVGLVGESGSGKSTAALALMRLEGMRGAQVTGQILFDGRDLMRLGERELRGVRGREIAFVLQSPLASLNPVLRIGSQFREAWRAHERAGGGKEAKVIAEAMASVNLPAEREFLRRYPSQLSVGQAQRLLIAMAILHRPRLLIADEPTSALDMITQAEILRLFGRLGRERQMAVLFISHDLLSVASVCERVAILERGRVVECARTSSIFTAPEHPYTQRLLASIPAPEGLAQSLSALNRATEADVGPTSTALDRAGVARG